jgi:hypothetical protein
MASAWIAQSHGPQERGVVPTSAAQAGVRQRPVRGRRELPLALAGLGLIDEYEFVVQPILAGHGPTLFAGLSERLELRLVGRQEFRSGAVALRYQPRRATA